MGNRWRTIRVRFCSLLVVACLLPAAAQAQDAEEILGEEDLPGLGIVGEAGYAWQGEADIDGGGKLQVNRFDVGLLGRTHFADRWRWNNTFFFAVNDYDFDGGGPWNTILNTRLASSLTYSIDDHWGVTGGGVFIFTPESGADWGDSFTGGGLVAGEYRASKSLFVSLGVAVISQIEDDVTVTPSVVFQWLPDDHWTLRVGAVPASGGAAAAAEAAYRIIDPLEVGLGVIYNQRRFRLDDSGPVRDGVGEDNNLPLRFRLGWNITPQIGLHLLAGVALAGEVQIDDSNGNKLADSDYDPAPYIGLRFVGGF